jgi:hypothetical protein
MVNVGDAAADLFFPIEKFNGSEFAIENFIRPAILNWHSTGTM